MVDKGTDKVARCPICRSGLDGRGACPNSDAHMLAAYRFMSTNRRLNRAARRTWMLRARDMERKMRRNAE